MSKHRVIQDYIDQYHAGEISESDFRKRLETDAILQQEFERHQQDLKIIRASAKAQLRMKAEKALEQHENKPTPIFSLKRVLSIAAAIALIIASFFVYQNIGQAPSNTELLANYFELPAPASERNGTVQSEPWNEAMSAYANEDFEKTIAILTPLVDQTGFPYPDRGKLYLGISHLMKDELSRSITFFDAISQESSYAQNAAWYRALAFLKMDNQEEAKNAFREIANQPRHFKNKEALEILEGL